LPKNPLKKAFAQILSILPKKSPGKSKAATPPMYAAASPAQPAARALAFSGRAKGSAYHPSWRSQTNLVYGFYEGIRYDCVRFGLLKTGNGHAWLKPQPQKLRMSIAVEKKRILTAKGLSGRILLETSNRRKGSALSLLGGNF
jgi:hypothetical protein